jgi:beta-lactamase regulating signal transducer with metallopeptidase domain
MIAEAFAYASLVSLLVGLGAASTERVLAEIKRPRRLAWVAAYLVALAFPLLSMLLVADAPAPLGARLDVTSREAAAVYSEIDWSMLLLSLWAAATTLLLLLYSAAHLRLRFLAGRWPRASNETQSVVVADDVGPAVLGILRPRIVLPRWLLDAPATVRSAVMAHELEHIAARDQALIVAGQLLTILLPWNLPLWWFARRLRAAIEIDCDARVLRRGVDAVHYADVLLAVGQRRSQSPYLAASLIEPVTQLERRIRIMLARQQPVSVLRAAAPTALALAIAACATSVDPPAIMPAAAPPADAGAESRFSSGVDRIVSGATGQFTIRKAADGAMTVAGPELVLHMAEGAQSRVTAERVESSPDRLVLVGNVTLELEGTSVTAARAVATHDADGNMTMTLENATVTRRAENTETRGEP